MRQVMATVAFMLSACGLHAPALHAQEGMQGYDPAYVDSPASRAAPDPARADGGTDGRPVAGRPADDERAHAEQLALAQQRIAQQIAQAQAAAQAQRGTADDGYADPPVGGHSMIRAVESEDYGMRRRADDPRPDDPRPDPGAPQARAAAPTFGQQLGAALVQDAAGVADAHLQRAIDGEHGGVILPRYDLGGEPPAGP